MQKSTLGIILTGLWITFSEFLRNEILFKFIWVDHYANLGLNFETLPINGVIWMVWSFLFAYFIDRMLKKFSVKDTILLSWIVGFVLMWLTIYNLQVLPLTLLLVAVPLSVVEIYVAVLIIQKLNREEK